MIVGLCGGGFVAVERALELALPDAEIVVVRPMTEPTEDGGRAHVDVLVPMGATVDAALLDATQPTLIQQFGVGLDGVDMAAARERGIPVARIPAAGTGNAVAVAEIAMLHLLALLRGYRQAQSTVAQGELGLPCGTTLSGKTVAVLGVGHVGTALIARLGAFGAMPIGVGRRERSAYPAVASLPSQRYYRVDELTTALGRSHVLIICCPLTEQTRGLIGRQQLAAMPRGGYLINVARGPVVHYPALLSALRTGHLTGAGIDVAWEEPINPADELLRENVTITPHIGAVTAESYRAMAQVFADNVHDHHAGRSIAHRAD